MHCIFCRSDSTLSKSLEHIMPESIGSKRRLLTLGVVCDQCNNYFARKVEEPILNHPSMRNIRAWHQIPNKKGRIPSLLGYIGGTDIAIGFRRGRDGKLEIEPERLRDKGRVSAEFEEGLPNGFLFPIEMNLPKREMSRFLCKMALETVAETFGKDDVDKVIESKFFDNIRTYARYGNNFAEWPYSERRIYPETTLMRHPDTNDWVPVGFGCTVFTTKHLETLFVFCFYGTEFVINVGGPSIHGYDEWLMNHGHISPMVERLGCRLVTEGEGLLQRHFLHGNFEIRNGLEFDKLHGNCP
ncbi:HNH endonuclease [Janthinobacterium sp. SUN120]|uniref:HNH endonuclease n=1 Tax=Janthinobacterium sp. SUN120 TaxID=3004099 RepID=UPI0025B0C3B4|nr:HNH endonuclease [Janthinobacterium sp. SUN120]MDN2713711.1 hypothetical protein [Janthinobacterium sp. SUN120]